MAEPGGALYDAIAGGVTEPRPPTDTRELIEEAGGTLASARAAGRTDRTVRRWKAAGRIPGAAERAKVEEAWRQRHPFDFNAALLRRLARARREGLAVVVTATVACSNEEPPGHERDFDGDLSPAETREILRPILGTGTAAQWARAEDNLHQHVQEVYFEDNGVDCHITGIVSVSVSMGPDGPAGATRNSWESRS